MTRQYWIDASEVAYMEVNDAARIERNIYTDPSLRVVLKSGEAITIAFDEMDQLQKEFTRLQELAENPKYAISPSGEMVRL